MYSVVCMCILEDSPGEVFVCGGNVIFAYLHENGNVIFVLFFCSVACLLHFIFRVVEYFEYLWTSQSSVDFAVHTVDAQN